MTWLTARRKTTLAWISVGALLFVLTSGAEILLWPSAPAPPDASARVIVAIGLLRWPAVIVALLVTSLFRIFDKESALDPVHGEVSERHLINQRVLANTIEQLVVFAPSLCAFAIVADDARAFRFLPIATSLFCLGRVLFWGGYHVSPNARGLGFNMTYSTSVGLIVGAFVLSHH